ncbi:chromatin remodelling complex Rsc7/Swp82 subunit-domain-containing protein [Lasiosphaeris hirsuta]|uniref:Chromatin remodelling complex Rsc7/Swp82 subunit-domain-containing protein n=1 Tax=Lasiosphaeris hirsuta TaxID=260670 RepID=A0AA40BA48_9PEZI|nr:chromatin remodelling complex Rsc7/Swp82 subunit-domain-containing protein [Lasiosphaeris hirsuta]
MYSAPPNGADSATINPAALNTGMLPSVFESRVIPLSIRGLRAPSGAQAPICCCAAADDAVAGSQSSGVAELRAAAPPTRNRAPTHLPSSPLPESPRSPPTRPPRSRSRHSHIAALPVDSPRRRPPCCLRSALPILSHDSSHGLFCHARLCRAPRRHDADIKPRLDLVNPASRGIKRSRSPDDYQDSGPPGSAGDDGGDKPRKRGRPMKSRPSGSVSETASQAPVPPVPQTIPPQTPQSQNAPLPAQTPAYAPPQASPPKTTPTKSTLKALPTVRDHTTDQLGSGGDEYLPREIDEAGEKKVMANGQLTGNREYRCRTFLVPNRGEKLFMLATECARVLGYRDSYLLFNKNRSLYKIIANQVEKDDLVNQEILPFSYRSRQIAIVTARSMFRQFGSRVIVNGRRVRDDYWETKARKQGFTEADPAGEKRPGASKAREAAAEANQNASLLGGPHGEIVYSTNPGQFGGAPQTQLVQPGMIGAPPGNSTRMPVITLGPDYSDTRSRDYSSILKTGPRQEITGPAYQDRTQPSPISELHAQAHHAAEFNRTVNQQRELRNDYMQNLWRRPHEQPPAANLSQPGGATDASAPASRPAPSPHTAASGMQQPGVVPNQSPQMMMTAAPYSQPTHAQNSVNSGAMRGMAQAPAQNNSRPTNPSSGSTGSMPQPAQNYSYPQNQIWPPTPQTPQHGYSAYTAQPQPSPHPQQSPAPQLRHSAAGSQVQPGSMSYSGMPGMGQGYGTPAQGMYPADQTPRQYMHQSAPAPAVTQPWSQQQTPAQWWTTQPQ